MSRSASIFLETLDRTIHGRQPDALHVIDIVELGVPFRDADLGAKRIGFSGISSFANAMKIPSSTLSRRKVKGHVTGDEADLVLRFGRIRKLATDVLGSAEKADRWLKNPRPIFNGKAPIELLRHEASTREVENLLQRTAHGVFL